MMSEMQIHTIARQMMEKHGLTAIAQAARNALTCESKGDVEEAIACLSSALQSG